MQHILSAIASGRLKNHLKRGGLIAYPTESCYGLGCLPTHTKALKKLIRLKRRPQYKGMIVIGDKLDRLRPLLQPLGETDRRLLESQWPARKTFLLPAADRIPAHCCAAATAANSPSASPTTPAHAASAACSANRWSPPPATKPANAPAATNAKPAANSAATPSSSAAAAAAQKSPA